MSASTRLAAPGALLLLSGCSLAPLGYLHGEGPAARSIADLGWGLIWLSLGVCVLVSVLLAIAIWRPRTADYHLRGDADDAVPIRWIEVGVAISVVFLVGAAAWTLWTAGSVSAAARPDLEIDVVGHQWWWEARYKGDIPAQDFTTANQLVIPAGKRVEIKLSSADVIHSFWVPRLGGKMDMIPGRTNTTWIEADKPGTYLGQCAEFCGDQHAKMGLSVQALEPEAFAQWWTRQLEPATATGAGRQLFEQSCGACHRVRGTDAGGIVGPDLSHFGARLSIGAGALSNDAEHLAYWINHTQAVKPGTKMPEIGLSNDDAAAIAGYLEGLK